MLRNSSGQFSRRLILEGVVQVQYTLRARALSGGTVELLVPRKGQEFNGRLDAGNAA